MPVQHGGTASAEAMMTEVWAERIADGVGYCAYCSTEKKLSKARRSRCASCKRNQTSWLKDLDKRTTGIPVTLLE